MRERSIDVTRRRSNAESDPFTCNYLARKDDQLFREMASVGIGNRGQSLRLVNREVTWPMRANQRWRSGQVKQREFGHFWMRRCNNIRRRRFLFLGGIDANLIKPQKIYTRQSENSCVGERTPLSSSSIILFRSLVTRRGELPIYGTLSLNIE